MNGPEGGLTGGFAGAFAGALEDGGGPPGIRVPVPTTRAAFSSRVIAAITFLTGSLPNFGVFPVWQFADITNEIRRTDTVRIFFIQMILRLYL
jgi:hypothetical protein